MRQYETQKPCDVNSKVVPGKHNISCPNTAQNGVMASGEKLTNNIYNNNVKAQSYLLHTLRLSISVPR